MSKRKNRREASERGARNELVATKFEGGDASEEAADDAAVSRVIHKGKARLVISGAEEVQSDSRAPRPVAIEPRVSTATHYDEEAGEPGEAEAIGEQGEDRSGECTRTVTRLENRVQPGKDRVKVDRVKFEKREARPGEDEQQEEQWGGGITPGWWVLIVGACALTILVGGLALLRYFDGDEAKAVNEAREIQPAADLHAGSPEKWFHDRAGSIGDQASDLLASFVSAKDDSARSKYVRKPAEFLELSSLRKINLSPRLEQRNEHSVNVGQTDGTAFLTLDCRNREFMPFRAYFTQDKEMLKIDWQATAGWSDVSMKELITDAKQHRQRIEEIKRNYRKAQEAHAEAVKMREDAISARRKQELLRKEAEKGSVRVVKRGEDIAVIADEYKISLSELLKHNQLTDPLIQAGQKLKIPRRGSAKLGPDIVIPPKPKPVAVPVFPEEIHTKPILLRCLMQRRNEFYAGPYNDSDHSAFMLLSADRACYLWAYTARDSDLDIELRRMLDHGRFVINLKKDVRVTVRIRRNQKDALPSQFEIVEIVHPEWVTPNE